MQMNNPQPTTAELFQIFGKIGLLSFGGPAGQIALMHRIVVDEKKWLDETRFLHALNYCMVLPGPEAMQLATYIGWLMRGIAGGLIGGLLFVLPGAVIVTALTFVYVLAGEVPIVSGLLFGLQAAVVAVVLDALMKVSKRALKSNVAYGIAIAAFIAIAVLSIPFPIVILAAALAGILLIKQQQMVDVTAEAVESGGVKSLIKTLVLGIAIWFLPLVLLTWSGVFPEIYDVLAKFFAFTAMITFGGAYAVLSYVSDFAVNMQGWLQADDMLAGLGLAETTPGPLILVLVFVGMMAAIAESGQNIWTAGLIGSGLTLWFTFVPCFVWIFAGAPYVERVRHVHWLASALAGVTAAVVGVIANLALWFAMEVFFDQGIPAFSSINLPALAIAIVAFVLLTMRKTNLLLVLALAAIAGMVMRFAGFA